MTDRSFAHRHGKANRSKEQSGELSPFGQFKIETWEDDRVPGFRIFEQTWEDGTTHRKAFDIGGEHKNLFSIVLPKQNGDYYREMVC